MTTPSLFVDPGAVFNPVGKTRLFIFVTCLAIGIVHGVAGTILLNTGFWV